VTITSQRLLAGIFFVNFFTAETQRTAGVRKNEWVNLARSSAFLRVPLRLRGKTHFPNPTPYNLLHLLASKLSFTVSIPAISSL